MATGSGTPTTAVRLLYTQIALRRGLPFDLAVPNAETVAALEEAERASSKHVLANICEGQGGMGISDCMEL